jgi:hypothetical protein
MIKQLKTLKEEGQMALAMQMMEGLFYTISAEYNGLFIEQEIMKKNKDTITRLSDFNIGKGAFFGSE